MSRLDRFVSESLMTMRLGVAPAISGVWLSLTACALMHGCAIQASTPIDDAAASAPTSPASQRGEARNFAGPFELREALTFYLVNETGGDFTLDLRFRCPRQVSMDHPVLIRVFDPDERVLLRHDDPGEKAGPPIPERVFQTLIKGSGKGVYQVAVTGFHGSIDFATEPKLPWGVFGYPDLVGHGSQFANAFVYLPPNLQTLSVQCEGDLESLALIDAQATERLKLAGASAGETPLPSNQKDVVWRLSAKSRTPVGEYAMNFRGMPVILCPDERTARAIHASVDVLDDGTICFHKFQVRAQELLKKYRAMPWSAFAVTPPVMVRHKQSWLSDPVRNQLLLANFGVFATLPEVLAQQNLDGRSPWFGTVFVWRDEKENERRDNPWTTYTRAGLVQVAEHAGVFAAIHDINAPFNPLYKNQALLNRVIIGTLQDLMMLREHEDPHTEFPHHQGGNRAFRFPPFTESFALVAGDCPDDVRAAWTEGLRRYVEAQTITCVCNTVNQWSAIWIGFEDFYQGTGETVYRDVLKRHIRWLATQNQWGLGFKSAGYFDEAEGPDATYAGITIFHLARLYDDTKDPTILDLLRRSIGLLNHTVAPEPNGAMLGVSSFCHRTPGDWTGTQMGGGLVMIADDLAEAAVHAGRMWMFPKPARSPPEKRAAEAEAAASLRFVETNAFRLPHIGPARIAYGHNLMYQLWKRYPSVILDGDWPMNATDRFTRNFGNEFLCVRRPSYYAFIYSGRPMFEWQKGWRAEDPRTEHPRNGGGLCIFWSSAFGSSILAKNWSAYAAHTLIVEQDKNGKPGGHWEDYWSIKSELDADKATAKITGAIRDQPLRFEKRYQFFDDGIRCEVSLTADQALQYTNAWECFPYPLNKPQQLRVRLLDENGQPVNKRAASAIAFETNSNEAHLIVFDQPRLCEFGTDYGIDAYNERREHGRVLAALPNQWQAGESQSFGWTMMVVQRGKVQQAIQQTIANRAK